MNGNIRLYLGDCLEVMTSIHDSSIDLIYADPPYFCNTDKKFGYHWKSREDYLGWIRPILHEFHRILKSTGSVYVHLDWHISHYVKIELDKITNPI